MARIATHLDDVTRCPHCAIAHPTLERVWNSQNQIRRGRPAQRTTGQRMPAQAVARSY